MSGIKKIIKEATLLGFIWWIVLLLVFLILPLYKVHYGELVCMEEIVKDKPFWLYTLAVFVWDWFVIVVLITISLIGLIFSKIGQWVYDIKDK